LSIVHDLNLFKDRTATLDATTDRDTGASVRFHASSTIWTPSTGQPTSAGIASGLGRIPLTSRLMANILAHVPQGHNHIHVAASPAARSDIATSSVPHSTARPPNSPAQNSSAKDRLRTALHGVEQLLQKVGRCLDGTPFKAPISALHVLIEVANVRCHLLASHHT
jgi:hypothetical protein